MLHIPAKKSGQMFSRPNHHHESQQSSAEPQTHGVRRARSPETSQSESSEGNAQKPKKSPHTKRIVKKFRPTMDTSSSTAQAIDLSLPPAATTNVLHIHDEAETSKIDIPLVDYAQRLEALLDSVLATVAIIQVAGTMHNCLTPYVRDAIRTILSTISVEQLPVSHPPSSSTPPKSIPQGKPHFAHPTRRTDTNNSKRSSTQPKASPAGHTPHTGPSPHQVPPHRPPKQVRVRDTSRRLILRLPPTDTLPPQKDIILFVTTLNEDLMEEYDRPATRFIAGANVTQAGNMVLTTTAPYTASQLYEKAPIILDALKRILKSRTDEVRIDLDAPWQSVVVQNIPGIPLLKVWNGIIFPIDNRYWVGPRNIYAVLEEAGINNDELKDVTILCQNVENLDADKMEGTTFSIRLQMSNPGSIARLMQEGLFLFNTQCRVSQYRPRRNARASNPTGQPSPTLPTPTDNSTD